MVKLKSRFIDLSLNQLLMTKIVNKNSKFLLSYLLHLHEICLWIIVYVVLLKCTILGMEIIKQQNINISSKYLK